jgi:hypothetical protein
MHSAVGGTKYSRCAPVRPKSSQAARRERHTLPPPLFEPDDEGGLSETSVCWVAGNSCKPDEHRMSSIIRDGRTHPGISVFGRGVFTGSIFGGSVTYAGQNDKYGRTYAGQCRDGYACGLGVATDSDGRKVYAEHGPDGQFDGRCLVRWDDGLTGYRLFERGEGKDSAYVFADGRCKYNREACAPDDPRLLALIAQVGPVEVRPAAPAPHPPSPCHSPPSNRPMDRPARFAPAGAGGRRGHRGAPPIPHAVAGGCATQPNSSRTAKHIHAATL